jgi:hypothetical protein
MATLSTLVASNYLGPQGPQGAQGNQGTASTTPGPSGTQGPQGAQGNQGSQGTAGSNGSAGAQGPQGAQGTAGSLGPTGPQGAQGAQGFQGTAGSNGAQGPQGAQGFQGTAGSNGAQGPQGAQGPIQTNIPASTNTTVVASDAGKFLDVAAGVTINSSTAFATGDAVSIYNDSASSITVTATGITLRLAGTATTGNRTIAQRGLVTVLCVGANDYVISGAGLT